MSIVRYRCNNPTLINEINHSNANRIDVNGKYFHCPLLMFLAANNEKKPYWRLLHENMINDHIYKEEYPLIIEKSKVASLNQTNHIFIHTQKKDTIYDEIKQWIK